ncbi:MAG: hypothetical protein DRI86_05645 [Bacteroidetes bacterium]|nr:MAG: hypothetical protein DRI86_05645 [Bacteroidota bacterium]
MSCLNACTTESWYEAQSSYDVRWNVKGDVVFEAQGNILKVQSRSDEDVYFVVELTILSNPNEIIQGTYVHERVPSVCLEATIEETSNNESFFNINETSLCISTYTVTANLESSYLWEVQPGWTIQGQGTNTVIIESTSNLTEQFYLRCLVRSKDFQEVQIQKIYSHVRSMNPSCLYFRVKSPEGPRELRPKNMYYYKVSTIYGACPIPGPGFHWHPMSPRVNPTYNPYLPQEPLEFQEPLEVQETIEVQNPEPFIPLVNFREKNNNFRHKDGNFYVADLFRPVITEETHYELINPVSKENQDKPQEVKEIISYIKQIKPPC